MICIAKPYDRRISPRLAVWAFKRTGLKPTKSGAFTIGSSPRDGCMMTAIDDAMHDGSYRFYRRLRHDYIFGVVDGWDSSISDKDSLDYIQGFCDAVDTRAALKAAGIE